MVILVTGGAGFVGSNLALSFKSKYPDFRVICFDNLKRRGSELNLVRLRQANIEFIHGDLRVKSDLESVGEVDVIIDAAAEPSVLAGINEGLDYLIQTNFIGTCHLLDFANKHGATFIFLSTSRVYPIESLSEVNYGVSDSRFEIMKDQNLAGFTLQGVGEDFPLLGSRSFYGSSKLASELFVEEYNKISGLKTVVNRCGVISGPYQMGKVDQGLMVLWMAKHFWKKELSYIGFGGEGKQVRDVLHIDDLFELIDWQLHHIDSINGQTFNVGGGLRNSCSLLELTKLCQEVTGNEISISSVKDTRAADIPIYITNNAKVNQQTDWSPKRDLRLLLNDIHQWFLENEAQLKPILS